MMKEIKNLIVSLLISGLLSLVICLLIFFTFSNSTLEEGIELNLNDSYFVIGPGFATGILSPFVSFFVFCIRLIRDNFKSRPGLLMLLISGIASILIASLIIISLQLLAYKGIWLTLFMLLTLSITVLAIYCLSGFMREAKLQKKRETLFGTGEDLRQE